MTDRDPLADLLAPLAAPRPLPPELRARLEDQLVAGADEDLTNQLAAAAAPRPLSPQLRARVLARLDRPRRHRGEAVVAAAAVLTAVAAGLVLSSDAATDRVGRPAAAPATSPPAAATTAPPPAAALGSPVLPSVAAGAPAASPATGQPAVPAPGPSPADAAEGSATAGSGGAAAAAGAPPQASVSSVTPDAGPVAGGTRITVTGRGLASTARLEVGGRPATELRVESDTAVSAVTPAAARAGGAQVVVVLADGSRHGLSPGFSYLETPVLSSLDPDGGPPDGGNEVVLTGRHFTRKATVRFGSTPAERVEWLSSTSLRAVAPSHLPGPVDVVVVTAGGTSNGVRYVYGLD